MAFLNLSNSSSNAYIRFMPSLDSWLCNKEEIELREFVIDHDSVKTGWGLMQEGSAPQWDWDAKLGVAGPQPSTEHRRGFSVRLHSASTGLVEWSSTGTGPVIGFEKIFDAIWAEKDAHPDMVPVVDYLGSKPLKIGKGSTREPIFRITKWVPRLTVPWDEQPTPSAKLADALEDDLTF